MRKQRTDCMEATEIIEFEKSPERIKQIMESAGSKIGSVHFIKKNGDLRKMAYRLHVTNPKNAEKPTGKGDRTGKGSAARKTRDAAKNLMTVYDVNVLAKQKDGKIGRGAYRMVALDKVVQITVKGKRYVIKH